jgi:hypothetical protein
VVSLQSINQVAAALSRANDILWQCRIAFRACEIIELDADAEDNGGMYVAGSAVFHRFRAMLLKPCVHLFFVKDVEDRANPQATTLGVESRARFGAEYNGKPVETPVGVVESEGADLGGTIAHEIAHGLGLKHNNEDPDPAVQSGPDNLMTPTGGTKLQPSQISGTALYSWWRSWTGPAATCLPGKLQ